MLERLRHVVDEYETIEQQLSDPEVLADSDQLRRLSKRYNELGPVVEAYRQRESRRADGDAAQEMLVGASGDERDLLVDEIDSAATDVAAIEDELRELMLPADPHDGKNVIVEIRGAEGGEEANLFARDLYEMYHRLGRAYHPPAHRGGGRDAGRAVAAAEQGARHGGVARPALRTRGT